MNGTFVVPEWRSVCASAARKVLRRRPGARSCSLELLETRRFLSSDTGFSGSGGTTSTWSGGLVAARATGDAGTLTLNNASQTYASLVDTTVTMLGRSELHITGTGSPIANSLIHLNSQDAWLFFRNIKPSVVNASYLNQVLVNGSAAVRGVNVRVVQHELGTVVIPHAPSYQALQTFTGPNFTGTPRSFNQYTIYNNSGELGEQFNNISSFKLKRGYMATVATKGDGSGASKVYVAQDHDLDVSILPSDLDNAIQFIRVLPWRWVSKKGASDLSPTTLNAQWFYNWNNDPNLATSLDAEYVPIRQQLYWPGLPGEGQTNVTHLSGFNEPDNPVEDAYQTLGNGSIEAALNYWPAMQSTGLRLGAPAVTDGGKAWLYSFMDQAIARGLRVDYIPIHMYQAGHSATSLYNWLKDIYDRYQLPVWITEFNNGANWSGGADPTYQQNAAAIDSFIQMMDNTPWIERYSVYSRVEAVREMTYADGSLTPAGTAYYNNASPIGYQQQPVPDSHTGTRSVARLALDNNALDASGHGNNGETLGGAAYVAGQRGQALDFDGASTHVRLPENAANANAFTFSAWVQWDGGANRQRVFDFGDGTNNYAYLTPSNGSKLRFAIKNGGAEQAVESNPLTVGQWTHVAVTLGNNVANLYVNGVLAGTATVTIRLSDLSPVNNFLGKSQFAADPLFDGRLDDVQINDVVLTGAQIAALMNNSSPTFAATTLTRGPAVRGLAFNGTIAGAATDADAGDSVTFGKASGPAWLTVAANGTLSGSPSFSDSGPQEFVVTATDSRGATSFAVLIISIGETYWRGDVNNIWSTNNGGNTNWATDAAGTVDTATLPTASTDVVFATGNATNFANTVLGANTSVRSLRVNTTSGVTIGGTHSLTLGANGVVIEPGAGAATINTSGGVVLGANQSWTNNAASTFAVASVISGAASLTKAGTGTLDLTGNNTYTGGTTIAEGTLSVGNGGATGSIAGNVINNGSLVVNRSTDVTLAGQISGSGSLTKSGGGRLTLSNVNTFSGGATIAGGIVRAAGNNALGTAALTIGPGGNATTARLELTGNVTIANAIALAMRNNASVAVQNISGNNRLSGLLSLDVGGGNAIFQSDAGLLTLGAITSVATGSRAPTLTGGGNGLVDGVISNGSGTVGIIKSGSGTWTLKAINTYTGSTTLNGGVLTISGAERIANASGLAFNGGTFATGGFSETLGTITLSANSSINFGSGTSTLIFSGLGALTAGTTLNIVNWTSGADRLFVGTTASLTAAQLAQISFNGTAAQQLASGEIVPLSSSAPTIASAATANPNPVTATSATLTVLAADAGGEANLTYTWTVTGKPAGAADPVFSVNGVNAAKSSLVTFSKVGTYTFVVTALDGSGLTATSSVNVVVTPVFNGIAGAAGTIAAGTSIAMGGADQFGDPTALSGSVAWSSNVGSITQGGVFTAPVSGATSATITAKVGTSTYTMTLPIAASRGWYRADAAGSSLLDSSGSGNHGTLTGAYGYVPGRAGSALGLTGGAADLPDGIVSGLTDFTFAAWVYLDSNPAWTRIFDFGTSTTTNMFLTTNAGGANTLRFAITTSGFGGEQVINAPALAVATWSHVAVTLVGDVGTIYVNGVAVGTNTNMTLRPASLGLTTNNYLGDSQYAVDPSLQGRLDDVRILGAGLNAAGVVGLRDAWQAPTVAVQANATPAVIEGGNTASLNVLGSSALGEAGLTYTWSVLGTPSGPVSFSVNGTNASKNSVATFSESGSYDLLVTISNALGASVTSTVTVAVTVAPPLASVTAASEAWGIGSHTLRYVFDRDVGPQDWASLVSIESADGNRTVTPTGFSYEAGSRTLIVSLPAASALADDNYVATLAAGSLFVAAYSLPFFVLAGDVDGDRTVGFDDLLTLAQHYGGLNKTWQQADFNGDGATGFDDLLMLAQNYGKVLAAPDSATPPTFSSVAIESAAPATAGTRRQTRSAVSRLDVVE